MKQKQDIFDTYEGILKEQGFQIVTRDESRPWGGFFVLEETQAQEFANLYFNGVDIDTLKIGGKLSPKILIVAPGARLSWQYHHRRAEIWQVLEGPVAICRNTTDEQVEPQTYGDSERVLLEKGERHRLIGLNKWGVVAEIWQHTDAQNPSDETDIVRVQDDFSRK